MASNGPESSSAPEAKPKVPLDAQALAFILKNMGVSHYQPNVIPQLLEYQHRYTAEILRQAKIFAAHADRKEINVEDVHLAIQSYLDFSVTPVPRREVLTEISIRRNKEPLPPLPPAHAILLPPLQFNQKNQQLVPKPEPKREEVALPSSSSNPMSSSSTSTSSSSTTTSTPSLAPNKSKSSSKKGSDLPSPLSQSSKSKVKSKSKTKSKASPTAFVSSRKKTGGSSRPMEFKIGKDSLKRKAEIMEI